MHARITRALRVPALLLVSLASLPLVACSSGSGGATSGEVDEGNPINHEVSAADIASAKSTAPIAGDRATLYVNGLGCPLCASNIDRQLERVKGVDTVAVDLSVGKVDIAFKPGAERPSPARLGEAVEDAGFTLVKVETGAAAVGGAR